MIASPDQKQVYSLLATNRLLVSTIIPINCDSCQPVDSAADNCNNPCTWNMEFGFKSVQSGGANFAFGETTNVFAENQEIAVRMRNKLAGLRANQRGVRAASDK